MEKRKFFLGSLVLMAISGAGLIIYNRRKDHLPLEVVPHVDLNRYLGEWYEIARMPSKFEKQCYGSKASYSLNSDGSISVENSCNKGSLNGKVKKARGKAIVVDNETNAKLKVSFFGPFYGDYWILDIGENYEYALVGEPSRKYLWILSRTPKLKKSILEQLVQKAINRGFNTRHLIFTQHKEKGLTD